MKQTYQGAWPINQLFILLTSISIFFVILKYTAALLVPFLIAIAIAIVLSPLFNYLERKHIPKIISLIFILIIIIIPVISLAGYIAEEVNGFINNIQEMDQKFDSSLNRFSHFLETYGIPFGSEKLDYIIEETNIKALVQKLATQAGNQFSNLFLIFFTTAFILMETDFLYNKLQKIMVDRGKKIDELMKIIEKIKSYFLIKAKTSLLTGLWIFAILWFYDIDYALLWSTLAFFLNFIPVIGSILAAIPAIIMAFLDQNMMTALWVLTWYIIVNTVVGNVLEPRIMGKGLGLSALIVFLSMTFWGWIFGPAGMILSVPLTMSMQFLFSRYEETEWIALLLSDYEKSLDVKKRNSVKSKQS
jgi:predicted PurR-regulated permease PerM